MNFGRFSDKAVEVAVELVNTQQPFSDNDGLEDVAGLRAFLRDAGHTRDATTVGEADLHAVKAVRAQLRAVFHAEGDEERMAALNAIAVEAHVVPEMTNHDETCGWHLHFGPDDLPIHRRLAGECAMALMLAAAAEGPSRLGTCQGVECDDAFVDTTRNHSQRYCSGTCSTRTRVSALRARRRRA